MATYADIKERADAEERAKMEWMIGYCKKQFTLRYEMSFKDTKTGQVDIVITEVPHPDVLKLARLFLREKGWPVDKVRSSICGETMRVSLLVSGDWTGAAALWIEEPV